MKYDPELLRDGDRLVIKGAYVEGPLPHLKALRKAVQIGSGYVRLTDIPSDLILDVDYLFHTGDEVRTSEGYGTVAQGVDASGQKVSDTESAYAYLVNIRDDPYGDFGRDRKPSGLHLYSPGKLTLVSRAAKPLNMDID